MILYPLLKYPWYLHKFWGGVYQRCCRRNRNQVILSNFLNFKVTFEQVVGGICYFNSFCQCSFCNASSFCLLSHATLPKPYWMYRHSYWFLLGYTPTKVFKNFNYFFDVRLALLEILCQNQDVIKVVKDNDVVFAPNIFDYCGHELRKGVRSCFQPEGNHLPFEFPFPQFKG